MTINFVKPLSKGVKNRHSGRSQYLLAADLRGLEFWKEDPIECTTFCCQNAAYPHQAIQLNHVT